MAKIAGQTVFTQLYGQKTGPDMQLSCYYFFFKIFLKFVIMWCYFWFSALFGILSVFLQGIFRSRRGQLFGRALGIQGSPPLGLHWDVSTGAESSFPTKEHFESGGIPLLGGEGCLC